MAVTSPQEKGKNDMTFYVCTIAKRKNGKRHIAHKCKSEKEAIEVASHINREKYKIQICSGDWTYIYHMN